MLPQCQLVLLLISFGSAVCSVTEVTVKLPDDEKFRKHQFVYMSIENVPRIDTVSSAPNPELFDADTGSTPHRIVFKPELLHKAAYRLLVSSGQISHTVNLHVERIPINAISSSVFLTGPTVNVNRLLNSLNTSIRIISKISVSGGVKTEAAVQVARSGSTSDFLHLWEAYEWLTGETSKLSPAVELMPDRCQGSLQFCRSRLTFASEHPTVADAAVQLGRSDNFLGFNLSWAAQTAEQMHAEPCGHATCLNGGVCDTTFKGVGFRCNCQPLPNIPWGPRCEHPIRSYENSGQAPPAYSRHWIGDLPQSAKSLEFSFDLTGNTQQQPSVLFALVDSSNTSLFVMSSIAAADSVTLTGSLLGDAKLTMAIQYNYDTWYHVLLLMQQSSITVVICQRNERKRAQFLGCSQRKEQTSKPRAMDKDFRNLWLEIGKGMRGCIQSLTVNGYSVDLAVGKIVGDETRITLLCFYQKSGCTQHLGTHRGMYKCGEQSVCYTVNDNRAAANETTCRCRCMGFKRMVEETVTASTICRQEVDNRCIKDTLVLSTPKSDARIRWVLSGNKPVPLPAEIGAFSVEALIRTRKAEALEVLSASEMRNSSVLSSWTVQISNGFPNLCSSGTAISLPPRCWPFPPTKVDDGEWHSVSAAVKRSILYLVVDGVTALHQLDIDQNYPPATVLLSASLPESNLRSIRVSGIYMSTTSNDTDRSGDAGGSFVVPVLTAGVSVGAEGVDPAPRCDRLPACSGGNEECVNRWGRSGCECRHGYERGSSGDCVAVNPCKKYATVCPFGGKCIQDSADPGFECECPVGVASSRLLRCQQKGYQMDHASSGQSTAESGGYGFPSRIVLIAFTVVLLMLALWMVVAPVFLLRYWHSSAQPVHVPVK